MDPPATFQVLPELVLDKIFPFLADDDLRSYHQVCHAWKNAVEKRPSVNRRRLELVQKIRENKENLSKKTQEDGVANEVSRVNRADGAKPGSLILTNCQNLLVATLHTSTPKANTAENDRFLTPTTSFPFQIMEEAEKSLSAGQKLFQCVKCKGPVPSPILSESPLTGRASTDRLTATKCRLITRMTGDDSSKFFNVEDVQLQKKCKSVLPAEIKDLPPPTTPLPPPVSTVDIPTTQALGEKMAACLVISELTSTPKNAVGNLNSRTALSSSGTIDVLSTAKLDCSSITYELSFANSSFGNPFSPRNVVSGFKDSLWFLPESPLTDMLVGSSSRVILTPDTGAKSQFSKSSISVVSSHEDLVENITLDSTHDPSCLGLVNVQSFDEKDNVEFVPPSDNSHNTNIVSTHEKSLAPVVEEKVCHPQCSPGACQSLEPSSLSKYLQSKCSSGYLSGRESVLRDDFISNSPEVSASRFRFICNSLDGFRNIKSPSRSQSVGNIGDEVNVAPLSFESSTSCPNLNESFVLECPNLSCSFRFCSNCMTGEHPGRSCRIIDSESFEKFEETQSFPGSLTNVSNTPKKDGEGKRAKGKAKGNKGKTAKGSLRRLARL